VSVHWGQYIYRQLPAPTNRR